MSEISQSSSSVADDYQLKLLSLINEFRQQANLPLLGLSPLLSGAAQAHAEDMARNNYFDHTGLDGSSAGERAQRSGYSSSFVGENIAVGNGFPEAVFEQWVNSSGHRENMLNENYTEIGVGYVLHAPQTEDSRYWVLLLGNPSV